MHFEPHSPTGSRNRSDQIYIFGLVSNLFQNKTVVDWKQGSGGITIKKTNQALVVGIYEEPMTPGQCNMVVERLGDYLYDQGL